MMQDKRSDSAGYQPRARVLLCELRERTSEKGRRYMSGWLGRANVIGFAEDKDEQDRTVWRIYLEQGAGASK